MTKFKYYSSVNFRIDLVETHINVSVVPFAIWETLFTSQKSICRFHSRWFKS